MKKNKPPFYSLWLVPKDPLRQEAQKLNNLFAVHFGSPQFTPHVTLNPLIYGDVKELLEQCLTLSKLFKNQEIRLKNVSTTDHFFMSVFFDVHKSKSLMEMNKKSKMIFRSKNQTYSPHLSLAYGNFSHSDKIQMMNLSKIKNRTFIAEELYLCLNDEKKLSWKIIDKFPFLT